LCCETIQLCQVIFIKIRYICVMKSLQSIALIVFLICGLNSCKKNKKGEDKGECHFYTTDSSFFTFKDFYAGTTKYIGLPAGYYPVNAHIQNKITIVGQGNYLYKNINCLLNGAACDVNTLTGLKTGANLLQAELVNCKGLNTNGLFNCDCPTSVSKTATTIYGIDTVRLLIKKIKYTKQFPKLADEGGGYPDVYLVSDNFGFKTGAKVDYNAAVDGAIEWTFNDTVTITQSYFNMSIQFYDTDWPLQDDYLGTWVIKPSDANNWETGIYNLSGSGTLEIDVERLK
jgi:hypothetical protein